VDIEPHNCARIFHDLPPYFWLCTWVLIRQSITHVHKGQVFVFLYICQLLCLVFFKAFRIYWTPVFTGVTAEINFFTPSGGQGGGDFLWLRLCRVVTSVAK